MPSVTTRNLTGPSITPWRDITPSAIGTSVRFWVPHSESNVQSCRTDRSLVEYVCAFIVTHNMGSARSSRTKWHLLFFESSIPRSMGTEIRGHLATVQSVIAGRESWHAAGSFVYRSEVHRRRFR